MKSGLPTVARRTLGSTLLSYREKRKISRGEAADAIGYSWQTLQRIEEGTQATKKLQVKALGELYGIPNNEMADLYRLALDGGRPGWWQAYKDGTIPGIPVFLETEQEARHIRVLETEFIPGLLQTPEYLCAVQEVQLQVPEDAAEAVRRLRVRRQEMIFQRPDPPRIEFVIGRAAVEYLDCLADNDRRAQIERLRSVGQLPEVDVRIVTGLHAAMLGSFNILTPGTPVDQDPPPFVYVDAMDGCRYIEDPDVVSLYERTFEAVRKSATPIEEYLT